MQILCWGICGAWVAKQVAQQSTPIQLKGLRQIVHKEPFTPFCRCMILMAELTQTFHTACPPLQLAAVSRARGPAAQAVAPASLGSVTAGRAGQFSKSGGSCHCTARAIKGRMMLGHAHVVGRVLGAVV